MTNYKKEARSVIGIIERNYVHPEDIEEVAAWLRKHDAQVLRDCAKESKSSIFDRYAERNINDWLLARASEIEGKG